MKNLIAIAILLFALPCFAGELQWDASAGAVGYEVSYRPVAATTAYTAVDVGSATRWPLPPALTKGTRYEFFVRAYTAEPRSYSGDSDHLRYTIPRDPIIVELPDQPTQIIINTR